MRQVRLVPGPPRRPRAPRQRRLQRQLSGTPGMRPPGDRGIPQPTPTALRSARWCPARPRLAGPGGCCAGGPRPGRRSAGPSGPGGEARSYGRDAVDGVQGRARQPHARLRSLGQPLAPRHEHLLRAGPEPVGDVHQDGGRAPAVAAGQHPGQPRRPHLRREPAGPARQGPLGQLGQERAVVLAAGRPAQRQRPHGTQPGATGAVDAGRAGQPGGEQRQRRRVQLTQDGRDQTGHGTGVVQQLGEPRPVGEDGRRPRRQRVDAQGHGAGVHVEPHHPADRQIGPHPHDTTAPAESASVTVYTACPAISPAGERESSGGQLSEDARAGAGVIRRSGRRRPRGRRRRG